MAGARIKELGDSNCIVTLLLPFESLTDGHGLPEQAAEVVNGGRAWVRKFRASSQNLRATVRDVFRGAVARKGHGELDDGMVAWIFLLGFSSRAAER